MIKFGICNEMFEGWKIEDIFTFARKLGYHGVEIAPFTLCEDVRDMGKRDRERVREAAEREGVEIIGLHWLLVKPEGLYINHPEETIRRKTSEYLKKLIDFCADLGGKIMVIGSPKQRNVLPEESFSRTWERTVKTLKEILPQAEEKRVVLCWEPLSSRETNFINRCEEAVKLIEEVAHPNFRLILDVKAMSGGESSIEEAILKGGRFLYHFHANDDNGLGPGFGKIDYRSIKSALERINYQGYLSVEVFDFSLGAEFIARRSMENLRAIWG